MTFRHGQRTINCQHGKSAALSVRSGEDQDCGSNGVLPLPSHRPFLQASHHRADLDVAARRTFETPPAYGEFDDKAKVPYQSSRLNGQFKGAPGAAGQVSANHRALKNQAGLLPLGKASSPWRDRAFFPGLFFRGYSIRSLFTRFRPCRLQSKLPRLLAAQGLARPGARALRHGAEPWRRPRAPRRCCCSGTGEKFAAEGKDQKPEPAQGELDLAKKVLAANPIP